MNEQIEIFCCYAHKDQSYLLELKKHLAPLLRLQLINNIWYDANISPGMDWEREINKHLNAAQVILLLISPDFMASDYCYDKEMARAIERHDRGEAIVIPVIVRPVYGLQKTPFGKLQALPTGAKPITSWPNLDEALFTVAQGIHRAIEERQSVPWPDGSWRKTKSYVFRKLEEYKYALCGADLSGADLSKISLIEVDLTEADLSGADLHGTNLVVAKLRRAKLHKANLQGANLGYADLSYADLSGADLSGANLSNANLKDATGITVEELERQAKSLKDATMPNGSIHP